MIELKTRREYVFVGGDYSQQEPRLLAHMCNDHNLIEVYSNNKDLYASIGALIFKKDYWECMEVWEDGSPNDDGKAIRNKCKSIVLGIMYGMGPKLLSTILNVSKEECIEILDEFYKMFPSIKNFTMGNEQSARENGFVEDFLGRRRHLPDINLPEFNIKATTTEPVEDVFLETVKQSIDVIDRAKSAEWLEMFSKSYKSKGFKKRIEFKNILKMNNIEARDNGGFISKTLTQCTNSRIQGSASSLTKKAMVDIFRNKDLADIGFRLLIPVHDELMGECPKRCVNECERILPQVMIDSASDDCSVKMKVDTYAVKYWNADQFKNSVENSYRKLIDKGMSTEDALEEMGDNYTEIDKLSLMKMCNNEFDLINDTI